MYRWRKRGRLPSQSPSSSSHVIPVQCSQETDRDDWQHFHVAVDVLFQRRYETASLRVRHIAKSEHAVPSDGDGNQYQNQRRDDQQCSEKQRETENQKLQEVEPRFRRARGARNVGPAVAEIVCQTGDEPERIEKCCEKDDQRELIHNGESQQIHRLLGHDRNLTGSFEDRVLDLLQSLETFVLARRFEDVVLVQPLFLHPIPERLAVA